MLRGALPTCQNVASASGHSWAAIGPIWPCHLLLIGCLQLPLPPGQSGWAEIYTDHWREKSHFQSIFQLSVFISHLPLTHLASHRQSISPGVYHRFILSSLIHEREVQEGTQLPMLGHHLPYEPPIVIVTIPELWRVLTAFLYCQTNITSK